MAALDHTTSSQAFSTAEASLESDRSSMKPASYRRPVSSKQPMPYGTRVTVAKNASTSRAQFRWNVVAAAIYLLITFIFLVRFAIGIVWSRKMVRNSQPIAESFAVSKLVSLAGRHGPRLAASEWITVPLTVGALRTTILLPSNWREWDTQKLEAVLAHELSHVARRDPLTQCLALLYRAIFWFNPLAWWLNQHIATLAEQASDEAALSGGADQKRYARTLLDFFDALQSTPGRIRWQGVSMARAGQAEQRLERILAWKGSVVMNMKKSLAAMILVLAVPVVYLTAAVRPAQVIAAPSNADISQQPAAPPVPASAPIGGMAPEAPVVGVPGVASIAPVAPVASVASTAPLAPDATAMAPIGPGASDHQGFSYRYGFDDEERFAIVSGKSESWTMSGSTQDIRHVEKLKRQISGDFIWFQRDEKSYIIRDQATVDRARAFWGPQEELGKKQKELGKQQEALGKKQAELGKQMEQVHVNVPDMTAALDKLKAKMQKLGPTATMEQIGELQSEIGELQSKMGEIQAKAGEQQGKLGEAQGALGEEQGKLGEQQGKLGEQQAELAEKATSEMKDLLDESIKNGTAKPEEATIKNPTL
jgi:beta-lactamase regulating signal transducer with metallopeptidase domain